MGFLDLFKKKQFKNTMTSWKEFGGYYSNFIAFGNDIYKSSLVRSCIRPLADMTSKAEITCSDKQLERLLRNRPNLYMNGSEFLKKVRTLYEVRNIVFILINREDNGKVAGLYPVPFQTVTPLEYHNRLFIKFTFINAEEMTVAWDDLAVLRKDYYMKDISSEDNSAILQDLELVSTVKQGLSNAVKATANLRGILKNTKSMLSDEDVKKRQQQFIKDYMNLENEGGIAALDATQEFQPISMSPIVTTYTQMKEIRENIYRYFGVNDAIMMGTASPEQIDSFVEMKITPFLAALSQELTSKIYTSREWAFINWISIGLNKLAYAPLSVKLSMTALVDRGAMTPNEWRALFGMDPIADGDKPIRRLDTAAVDDEASEKEGEENEQ